MMHPYLHVIKLWSSTYNWSCLLIADVNRFIAILPIPDLKQKMQNKQVMAGTKDFQGRNSHKIWQTFSMMTRGLGGRGEWYAVKSCYDTLMTQAGKIVAFCFWFGCWRLTKQVPDMLKGMPLVIIVIRMKEARIPSCLRCDTLERTFAWINFSFCFILTLWEDATSNRSHHSFRCCEREFLSIQDRKDGI